MITFATMHKQNKRSCLFLLLLLFLGMIACQTDQPVDPGDRMLENIFQLGQVADSTFQIEPFEQRISGGELAVNPAGNYLGYSGATLLQFADSTFIPLINSLDYERIELVLPIEGVVDDEGSGGIETRLYRSDWDETSQLDSTDLFGADGELIGTGQYPDDTTTVNSIIAMTVRLNTEALQNAAEEDSSRLDLLLRGSSDSLMTYFTTRVTERPPYISLVVDDTTRYSLSATGDYGLIAGGTLPPQARQPGTLWQSTGKGITLEWQGSLDSLSDARTYIHSAELEIPIDTLHSFAGDRNHVIVIAEETGDEPAASEESVQMTVSSVSPADGVLRIARSPGNQFRFRDYIQRLLNEEEQRRLSLYYQRAGGGIQHLVLHPERAKLEIIYSKVEE